MQYVESVNGYYYKVLKSGQKTRIAKSEYDRRTQQVGGNKCTVEIEKRTIYTQNQEGIYDAHFLKINGAPTDVHVESLLNVNETEIIDEILKRENAPSILDKAREVCNVMPKARGVMKLPRVRVVISPQESPHLLKRQRRLA